MWVSCSLSFSPKARVNPRLPLRPSASASPRPRGSDRRPHASGAVLGHLDGQRQAHGPPQPAPGDHQRLLHRDLPQTRARNGAAGPESFGTKRKTAETAPEREGEGVKPATQYGANPSYCIHCLTVKERSFIYYGKNLVGGFGRLKAEGVLEALRRLPSFGSSRKLLLPGRMHQLQQRHGAKHDAATSNPMRRSEAQWKKLQAIPIDSELRMVNCPKRW